MSRVIHFDMSANNPELIMEFYRKSFGWEFRKWDGPVDYWLIMTGKESEPGIDGGLSRKTEETIDANTIGVDDLESAMDAVKRNGGTIVQPRMAIPGVGYMAYFNDPDGNLFGLMEEDTTAT